MRVVAVLGGGGAKAVAHVGAWKAIREVGASHGSPRQITHVVGTSMGAVIGAALAAGATTDEVAIVARSLSRKDVAPLDAASLFKGVFASHILKAGGLRRVVSRLVTAQSFAELKIPLTVTATDLDSGDLVLFGGPRPLSASGHHPLSPSPGPHPLSPAPQRGEGVLMAGVELHDALYASSALPLYYPPLRLDGRRLADGGLRAVLPLGPAQRIPADLVVAVHVGPGFDEPPRPPLPALARLPPPLIRAHREAERIMMAAQAERVIAEWPKDAARLVVVRPVAEREATFAVEEIDRYIEAGYQETTRALAG